MSEFDQQLDHKTPPLDHVARQPAPEWEPSRLESRSAKLWTAIGWAIVFGCAALVIWFIGATVELAWEVWNS